MTTAVFQNEKKLLALNKPFSKGIINKKNTHENDGKPIE